MSSIKYIEWGSNYQFFNYKNIEFNYKNILNDFLIGEIDISPQN